MRLDNFDLSQQYKLDRPGRYKVQFDGRVPVSIPLPREADRNYEMPHLEASKFFPSNIVEIEIKPALSTQQQ